ncbi:hypothetical protein BX070DRAFT_251514 [Coemansia spiralis]|nr:hypothetical protein BX070DRAFT_251514 [Coemansia spiralis]
MNTSASASDALTPTTAGSATGDLVSPAAQTQGFSLLSRPDFVAGLNSFRAHFGQEVRSKITEGYTFLGLDKAGLGHEAGATQHTKQRSTDARSAVNAAQPPASSSAGSGISPTHSNNSRASHHNRQISAPPAQPKPAKTSAAAHSNASRESLSTLDNLLSYIKHSPSHAAATAVPRAASGLPGLSAVAGASNFGKTVILLQAKSRLDAVDVALSEQLSVKVPPVGHLLSLRGGASKLKAQIEQKQQQQRKRQQKQKQQQIARIARSIEDTSVDGAAKDTGKRGRPDPTVASTRASGIREARARRAAPDTKHSAVRGSDSEAEGVAEPRASKKMLGRELAQEADHGTDHGADRQAPQKRFLDPFSLHIRVPKKARRNVIEAITSVATAKRLAAAGETAADAEQPDRKRVRRSSKATRNGVAPDSLSPAASLPASSPPPARSRSSSLSSKRTHSPVPSARRPSLHRDASAGLEPKSVAAVRIPRLSRSRSVTRSDPRRGKETTEADPLGVDDSQRGAAGNASALRQTDARRRDVENGPRGAGRPNVAGGDSAGLPVPSSGSHSAIGASMQASEVELLRRQSIRLEEFMRSFKRSGDAERDPGGRIELEVGHYLESLSCCLEDFWCRRALQPPSDVNKNWQTMLGICEYLYRRCDSRELSSLRGCTGLVTACVYYQLASVTIELLQEHKDPSGARKAAANASKYMREMERYEQGWRALLSAHDMARLFPQTWLRCQESPAQYAQFEIRSHPYTRKWPAVAYPLSSTSNPLDVANFVRQIGHEWLGRLGLSLKMPNQKDN